LEELQNIGFSLLKSGWSSEQPVIDRRVDAVAPKPLGEAKGNLVGLPAAGPSG